MKKNKFNRVFRIILISFLFIIVASTITLIIITYNMDYTLPKIMNIELYDNEDHKYLSYCNNNKQSYVQIDKISPYVIDAFIAIEDKRFYEHKGIDFVRIGGAIIANVKNKKITEGASTITQQYVRTLFLNVERTFKRKINEMMIAINLERKYSKNEILEGYLNTIYFDHGIYGIEDASIYYFNKHAFELSLVEACCLASIPKGPTLYSPIKNSENNLTRRNLILKELLNDGKIDDTVYQEAINTKLTLVGNNPNDDWSNAPYFQDVVINELKKLPNIMELADKGLKVYTTLDTSVNNLIVNSINSRIPDSEIELACYAIEPTTGKVLAIIGGKDYSKSSYNRATNSVRQPGSTIKPFLYLAALESGFTVVTTFKSEATTFYVGKNSYSPHNFQSIYANMDISMVYAIATSDNIYAMKTHLFLGTDKLVSMLKKLNFKGDIPAIPSLALGTNEVSVAELGAGYQALANEGIQIEPIIITKITDFNDQVLYTNNEVKKEVANKSDVYLLNEAMTFVFDNGITYNIRPTGASIASMLNGKYAGKSGSTDTDNWMVGYNPNILFIVWTGYDDNRIIETIEDIRFGKYIWADVISKYKVTKFGSWYEKPNDIIGIDLNPMTGFYASFNEYHRTIYFRKSNIPWYIRLLYTNKPNSY